MYTTCIISETEGTITEPVTLSEVKDWLQIDYPDKDALLTGMITGARRTAEKFLNLHLVEKTVVLDVTTSCAEIVPLPFVFGLTDLVVQELDESDAGSELTIGSEYFIRGNQLRLPVYGRYTVSYKTVPYVPEDIKEGVKMEIAERFANRGENNGELSKSAQYKLQPYRIEWL